SAYPPARASPTRTASASSTSSSASQPDSPFHDTAIGTTEPALNSPWQPTPVLFHWQVPHTDCLSALSAIDHRFVVVGRLSLDGIVPARPSRRWPAVRGAVCPHVSKGATVP